MKAVALLLMFVVFAALPAETSAWRWFRRVAEGVKKVAQKVSDGVKKVVDKFNEWKNRHGRAIRALHEDLTEEEMIETLATRDINELVEVDQLSDADKAEFSNIQREARDLMDQMDSLED
ncbi:uncharacterized protein LOC124133636 [Haliotis rufescens]|uniref:uncharacterized protein LOC124133636 n=1 Tax=Haliotis rufescens TaxID=6454 RepID=UPI00201F541B|nr:uncharacterized protein LOC124133636 [Haliotis rufescens]